MQKLTQANEIHINLVSLAWNTATSPKWNNINSNDNNNNNNNNNKK